MRLKIAMAQMDVRLGKPQINLARVEDMAAQAAQCGATWLVLPELWSTGYDLENAAAHATPLGQGVLAAVAALAKQHNLYILGSTLSLLDGGGFGNTAVLFNPQGATLAAYTKTHLFRLMNEDQFLTAGANISLVELSWGTAGLTICYDLRFPELYRRYALAGAKLVFVPAEWPHPRLAHWRTLLRARAIENQIFIVACNRVGSSKNTDFFGHSCIIDPWGETVIEAGEQEQLVTAVIDLDQVDKVRAKIPIFRDRRPYVYND